MKNHNLVETRKRGRGKIRRKEKDGERRKERQRERQKERERTREKNIAVNDENERLKLHTTVNL